MGGAGYLATGPTFLPKVNARKALATPVPQAVWRLYQLLLPSLVQPLLATTRLLLLLLPLPLPVFVQLTTLHSLRRALRPPTPPLPLLAVMPLLRVVLRQRPCRLRALFKPRYALNVPPLRLPPPPRLFTTLLPFW